MQNHHNITKIQESVLKQKTENAKLGGGIKKIEAQHQKGKLTARERIKVLLDEDSFEEIGMLIEHRCQNFNMSQEKIPGDGVITGYGTINKRLVFVYSQDFTVFGGSLGEYHAKKISNIISAAIKAQAPIIGINDSGGARIQEGVDSLSGYGTIFAKNVQASGIVPQITVIMGPCAGGAVYSPALTDFIFMVQGSSYMFITGPEVIKTVTGESISKEKLGGSKTHTKDSGVADLSFKNDIEALIEIRRFFNFIPSSNRDRRSQKIAYNKTNNKDYSLNILIPQNQNHTYNMQYLINSIVDNEDFFELQKDYAKNIIIGFGSMAGQTVGIVANQPTHLAGCLDINASKKGSRFIRFCDAFNIPIITLVDVPGFLPGVQQEQDGIIKYGAKILYAYAEATVPKITVITKKAYGGAYIVMNSKHLNSDVNYAWPSAEIAVMGAEGAAEIIFKKSTKTTLEKNEKIKEYKNNIISPYIAASRGYIDEIIKPEDTRWKICKSLAYLKNKNIDKLWKKHDNLPL